MPSPVIVFDPTQHGRYWLVGAIIVMFLFMHRSQIIGVIKPMLAKLKGVWDNSGPRPGWGWMITLVLVVLVWPGQGSPLPVGPTPAPVVQKQDLFAKQCEVYRALLAEALEQHATQDFKGDDEASAAWNQRQNAVVQGAFAPFADKMIKALSTGPEKVAEFARQLKAGEIQ